MRLPTASYNLPSRNSSRLVNVYPQTSDKAPVELVGLHGTVPVRVLEGAGRGLHVMRGRLYGVAGTTLYDVLKGTEIGTVLGTSRLMFADNGLQMVTDTGYIYDGTTLSVIADVDKPPLASVGFVDGFIVGVERQSQRFVSSAFTDASDWDGLMFDSAGGSPDFLVTSIVDHRQIILAGTDSMEIWSNNGGPDFPFERMGNGFVEQGCLARLGMTKADHSVFWFSNDKTIRRLSGQTAVRVSQAGVEEAIAKYARVDDCEAFSYTFNGHIFVVFRFPTAGATWVFDCTTGEWHERDSSIVATATLNGKVYVQFENGSVAWLSNDVYTENGQAIRKEVTFPTVYSENARQFLSSLDVIMRTGDAPSGLVPYLTLEVSHDGGNTWHTLPVQEMGRIGEYAKVIRFLRLGSGLDTVFRLSNADAVPWHLVDTQLTAQAGLK